MNVWLNSPSKWLALMVLAACGFALGCGGSEPEDDRPPRTPVSGVVLLDGDPVEGASITFNKEDPKGTGAGGKTDAEGNFQISTYNAADGAMPGSYIITVRKMSDTTPDVVVSTDDDNYDPTDPAQQPKEAKNTLPEKYADKQTSDLKITVGEEPIEDHKIELTSE